MQLAKTEWSSSPPFLNDSEKQRVQSGYELAPPNKDLYPHVNQPLYIKKELDSKDEEELDHVFGTASLTMINVLRDVTDTTDDLELTKLYSLLPKLETLPEATLQAAHEKAVANDMMQKQSGIMLSKAFYDELGFDLGAKTNRLYCENWILYVSHCTCWRGCHRFGWFAFFPNCDWRSPKFTEASVYKGRKFFKKELDTFSTASLITRCTNDIQQVQQLNDGCRMICYAPILGIGGIIMAVNKSASMSWIIALRCSRPTWIDFNSLWRLRCQIQNDSEAN